MPFQSYASIELNRHSIELSQIVGISERMDSKRFRDALASINLLVVIEAHYLLLRTLSGSARGDARNVRGYDNAA